VVHLPRFLYTALNKHINDFKNDVNGYNNLWGLILIADDALLDNKVVLLCAETILSHNHDSQIMLAI